MPEIKIKHIVSFSSEDPVHKAENVLRSETFRKWKCASAGEKSATVVLQFEKASKISGIDIGNESSAFIEVLVGRSSDSTNNFQVLVVSSSFMTPLESRNEQQPNRVRMFKSDKLSQSLKDEKWDMAQIVCRQPFNNNITYGLSFIKFHSPPDPSEDPPTPKSVPSHVRNQQSMMGAFKLKSMDVDDDDDDDTSLTVGSWFSKRNIHDKQSTSPAAIRDASSYASAILSSPKISSPKASPKQTPVSSKRKYEFDAKGSPEPPKKKESSDTGVIRPKMTPKATASPSNNKPRFSTSPSSNKPRFSTSPSSNKQQVVASPIVSKNVNHSTSLQSEVRKKPKSKKQLMEKVVFVLSGFVNPSRSNLRDKAVEMGAKYKADWDSTCTHLICAFVNTPKYSAVLKKRGKIVTKDWINDCYSRRELLPWKKYMLGKYSVDSSSDETESDLDMEVVQTNAKKHGTLPKQNDVTMRSPKTDSVQTQEKSVNEEEADTNSFVPEIEEDALQDFLADTDSESSSGGDTEDEIRKVEDSIRRKNKARSPAKAPDSNSTSPEVFSKPDTSDLPLPGLPNLFKNKSFYMYGQFSAKTEHDIKRFITAYNGVIEDYMRDSVKYVITESKWDRNFEAALADNEDLIFVRPQWLYKCHEAGKLVPYQPFIVIPDDT